ncbi:hypothetical protein Bca52824_045988 [Brassica carinata]|uniref:Transcription repressor n=1 Tax=Brassica carinata TaxID=52824 RepID=A0A8X7RC23_BRACI|nr:hypothetical protein Bca52824_045988 [Brassica carinata]
MVDMAFTINCPTHSPPIVRPELLIGDLIRELRSYTTEIQDICHTTRVLRSGCKINFLRRRRQRLASLEKNRKKLAPAPNKPDTFLIAPGVSVLAGTLSAAEIASVINKYGSPRPRMERWRRTEVFAVAKWSSAPQKYFRDAVVEMIIENGINHQEELKEVLICYLRFNTDEYHVDMNINICLRHGKKSMEERLRGKQNDTYSKLGSEETGVSVEKVKAKWWGKLRSTRY